MAPTKKSSKNTHLADQESTGMEIPAELNIHFDNPAEQAEDAAPKRRGRPKSKKASEEPQAEVKENTVPETPAEFVPANIEDKPSIPQEPVQESAPAEVTAEPASAGEATNEVQSENPEAAQGDQGANGQQKFQNQQNRRFDKFNKNNRRFDKNNRQNQRFQPE